MLMSVLMDAWGGGLVSFFAKAGGGVESGQVGDGEEGKDDRNEGKRIVLLDAPEEAFGETGGPEGGSWTKSP